MQETSLRKKMMKAYSKWSVAIVIVLLAGTAMLWQGRTNSQFNVDNNDLEIENLVNRYKENRDFNGAILAARDGEVVYTKGIGFANMEWDIPNSSNTKFRIGSVSKQFTSMLIMQLIAEDKVSLDEPIITYLPNYPEENGAKINVHHLMSHTSGIPNNYKSEYVKEIRPDSESPQKLVDEFSSLELEFEPGERFSYSNAGYQVLGLIIEKVTGSRLEEVLSERIFKPLEMNNTGFDKHRALIEHRADGYFNSYGIYYNANYVNMSKVFAAGALYSTVEDLYKWDRALDGEKLLPKQHLDKLFRKYVEDSDFGGHYGYGWNIKELEIGRSNQKIETYNHDGVIDGFCAIITRIPSKDATIILLSNVRRAPLNSMTKAIMGVLLEKDYDLPKKSLAYSTLDIMNDKGIEQGLKFYQKKRDNLAYFLIEDEVNIVSYLLHQSERTEAAAQILKLGIESFPEAFNLYDSYGEMLRKLGRKDASIKNYKKSLDLNPNNQNGIQMLKEMGVDYPPKENVGKDI